MSAWIKDGEEYGRPLREWPRGLDELEDTARRPCDCFEIDFDQVTGITTSLRADGLLEPAPSTTRQFALGSLPSTLLPSSHRRELPYTSRAEAICSSAQHAG